MSHLDTYKAPSYALLCFLTQKATKHPIKKCNVLMSAEYKWPLNAVLHKKLINKIKKFDFIADRSCLLFPIILKVLSRWEVIRTQGKYIKWYKNFWKDFVVEQNPIHPNGDFWSYLNRLYKIVVFWDDRTTGNMEYEYMNIAHFAIDSSCLHLTQVSVVHKQ